MLMLRFKVSLCSLLLLMLISVALVQAQETPYPVTTIPVASLNYGLELSPDNRTLALYENGIIYNNEIEADLLPIRLLDLTTGEEIRTLTGQTDYTTDVAFSPDGQSLVSFHQNGDLILWDVASGEQREIFPTYNIGGGLVKYLADGQRVVLSLQRLFMVLDTETGYITKMLGIPVPDRQTFMDNYTAFPGTIDLAFTSLATSPDNDFFVTSTGNDAVILWEIATNNRQFLKAANEEKPGLFSVSDVEFSADGNLIAANDFMAGTIHIWDQTTQAEGVLPFKTLAFALSPDQQSIVWVEQGTALLKMATLTDPENPVTLLEHDPEARPLRTFTSVRFTTDGSQVILGGLANLNGENALYIVDLP
jgi:WD40 repeat protein